VEGGCCCCSYHAPVEHLSKQLPQQNEQTAGPVCSCLFCRCSMLARQLWQSLCMSCKHKHSRSTADAFLIGICVSCSYKHSRRMLDSQLCVLQPQTQQTHAWQAPVAECCNRNLWHSSRRMLARQLWQSPAVTNTAYSHCIMEFQCTQLTACTLLHPAAGVLIAVCCPGEG
jgi:hypothetical protein